VTRALTVATWNIYGGRTWEGTRVDLELTLATLRRLDADLVAVQEVDRDQARSHGTDQARLLGEALGMEWRYAPALLGTPGDAEGWRAPEPGTDAALRPLGGRIVSGPASDHRAVVVALEWR
jgi:endonuclease/exonuclease/phosphatase family metal-dependent hydrolase